MTITFLLFYYEPEVPTINYLFQPIIDELLKNGHTVNVITPNPVRGISEAVQEEYKHKYYEVRNNLHIYRVPSYTYKPHKFSKLKLLHRYISVSKNVARKLKKVKSDVVFVSSNPPLLLSYLATKYCARKNIKIVYNVQDIYPDNVFPKKSLGYKTFNWMQVKSLKRATEVITISETMKNTLLQKGDFGNKITVVYNWDISRVEESTAESEIVFDDHKFNVVYAGNIGYMQDVDVILRAAELLAHNKNIMFTIIGEGSQSGRIKDKILTMNLPNTKFYDPVDVLVSGALYKKADVNIISILPGVIKTALPLKTASCLAASKPIVFIGLDDAHQETWAHQLGIFKVSNRNFTYLTKVLKNLVQEKDDYAHLKYDDELFSRTSNYLKYYELLIK